MKEIKVVYNAELSAYRGRKYYYCEENKRYYTKGDDGWFLCTDSYHLEPDCHVADDVKVVIVEARFDKSRFYLAMGKAIEAAHAVDVADTGTYNFDTPIIKLPDGTDISEFRTRDHEYFYGFSLEEVGSGMYKGYCFISGVCNGMQMRRTKQAEAVADSLKAAGFTSGVYYQMD